MEEKIDLGITNVNSQAEDFGDNGHFNFNIFGSDAIVGAERVCLQTCQAKRQQQAKENFEKDESR